MEGGNLRKTLDQSKLVLDGPTLCFCTLLSSGYIVQLASTVSPLIEHVLIDLFGRSALLQSDLVGLVRTANNEAASRYTNAVHGRHFCSEYVNDTDCEMASAKYLERSGSFDSIQLRTVGRLVRTRADSKLGYVATITRTPTSADALSRANARFGR